MKKLLEILVLGLLLSSCATTDSIVSSGKVKKNISKSELSDAFITSYPGDDPLIPGSGSEFFSESNSEIIWGSSKNKFYVFKNVSEPVSCGIFLCKNGNGTLESWHSSLDEARDSISNSTSTITSTTTSSTNSILNKSESERRKALVNRWNDPGYTEAGFPQKESFWIFLKSPPPNANLYAELACRIAKTEYNLSGFTITVWDFNKKKYGKARCY